MGSQPQQKIRTIRYSETAERQLGKIAPNKPRLDDALCGVEWAIATNPTVLLEIPTTQLRLIKTDSFPGIDGLAIYVIEINDDLWEIVEVHEIRSYDEEDSS